MFFPGCGFNFVYKTGDTPSNHLGFEEGHGLQAGRETFASLIVPNAGRETFASLIVPNAGRETFASLIVPNAGRETFASPTVHNASVSHPDPESPQVAQSDKSFHSTPLGENVSPDRSAYAIKTYVDIHIAQAQIIQNSQIISEYTLPVNSLPLHLSPRRVLMLALYHALQKIHPTRTPWGALTGIRPSKMVRDWLDSGYSHEKILQTMADPFCCTPEKTKLALLVATAEQELTARIYNNATNPIGVYISIPFCPTRCVYCSFNVDHKPSTKNIEELYIAKLIQEIKAKAKQLQNLNGVISSIYIGGGTPTVLSDNLLQQLLDAVQTTFGPVPEYTVEAGRPDTLTQYKLALLHRYGVNRIAVNPQTLSDATLKIISRKHTSADFFRAFALTRDAGFDCINTDIIVGLPSETPSDVRRTMEQIAKISPENITVHTLAVKRASRLNAAFADYALPDAKTTEEMLAITSKICKTTGLVPYYMYRQKNMVGMFENVGYSKPGHECLYNVGMMAETQTVLGIGAGAVSKFVKDGKITREFNVKNPEIYLIR